MIISRLLPSLVVLLLLGAGLRAAPLPLQDGEQLRYRVSWAIVPGAGEIKIEAQHSLANPEHLIVTSTTGTRAFAKMLLSFNARSESTFDLETGLLRSMHEKAMTRNKPTEHTVTFDYTQREATLTRVAPPQPPLQLPIPDGNPADLILGLLQTRTWTLQPGEKQDSLVLFDDDFYELTIHAIRYEEVRTPLGTFNTLLLEPRMEKTPPKGMFKRGSRVRVWIAQNDHRLPVRFEVEFKIGTGTATLEAYRPPATAAASAIAPVKGTPGSSGPKVTPGAANVNAPNPRS